MKNNILKRRELGSHDGDANGLNVTKKYICALLKTNHPYQQ